MAATVQPQQRTAVTTTSATTSVATFKSLSDTDLSSAAARSSNKHVTITDENSEKNSTEKNIVESEKSKTLPSKNRQTTSLKRASSLKRSITLPRNPFVGMAKKSKPSVLVGNAADDSMSNVQSINQDDSPSRSNRPSKTSSESMKNFFNRVVSQMSASSLSRTLSRANGPSSALRNGKCDITEEQIAEWKRRFAAESGGKVPGVIGIRNHGNTCFMNAILQCLSYTDLLAEYFVLDQYKLDLKRKRRLQPLTALQKGASSKGEVTEQLACILKSLWSLQYDPEISIRFKSLVEKHASQFKGNNQHDAQEFLLWLLDRVHEDLNLASKRRYRPYGGNKGNVNNANGDSYSDEALAAEALANYIRHNRSFIMDVFQAQFHSSLTCPQCRRQSKTFDPFLCVSLPIPQKQLIPVYVTVVYIDQTPRQVKLGLTIGAHETIGDLRRMLSKDTGIPLDQLLLTEIDGLTFRRTFYDTQPVTSLKSEIVKAESDKNKETNEKSNTEKKSTSRPSSIVSTSALSSSASVNNMVSLYCIELPQHREISEGDGAFVMLTWVNVLKEGPIERRFGSPYTIQVSREILYSDFQKLLMKEMAPILHDDILIGAQKVPLFKIRIIDGFDEPSYLDSSVDLPMYTLAIEQAINMCSLADEGSKGSSSGVPLHVKLVLEWDMPAKTQVINDDSDQIEEHASVKQVAKSPEEATSVTLQECFSLYTRAETLGQGEAWFCPACNRKQEVVTQMVLWTAPDVLIINLKRFRQSATAAGTCNKLSTAVEFPLEGFDMTPNMRHRNSNKDEPTDGSSPPSTGSSAPPSESAITSTAASAVSSHGLKMWNTLSASWRKSQRRRSSHHAAAQLLPQLPQDATSTAVESNNNIYDLYAVCNHHGSDLQSGHYTATCKNPTDGQWYHFDDVHTRVVDKRDVVSVDAYILFYQRRQIQNETSSSSSSSSGSSGADGCHWVYRMPEFGIKRGNPTTATAKTSAGVTGGEKSPVKKLLSSSFKRNSGKYATMPTKRSTEPITCDTNGHHSDGGEHDDDDDDDEELSSDEDERMMTSSVTQNKLAPLVTTESHDDVTEDHDDDVTRPLDKNDVD